MTWDDATRTVGRTAGRLLACWLCWRAIWRSRRRAAPLTADQVLALPILVPWNFHRPARPGDGHGAGGGWEQGWRIMAGVPDPIELLRRRAESDYRLNLYHTRRSA